MKSVVLICLNYDVCKEVGVILANKLGLKFVDSEGLLNSKITDSLSKHNVFGDSEYQILENKVVDEILKMNKSVICVEAELFLANDNFARFSKKETVYINDDNIVCNIKNKKERQRCEDIAIVHNNLNRFLSEINSIIIERGAKDLNSIADEIAEKVGD